MTQSHRLPDGGQIDRGLPLSFTFNGQSYEGYTGDTLASALLANGVHFVARSWKYHRPRGIVTAGVTEPNAIVQLESGACSVPNPRATELELYQGLSATSVNAKPDIERDRMAIMQLFSRFIPAGFYYKTFMWPRRWWMKYEAMIRDAAGLGHAPPLPDPDRYDKTFAHCDVLIVGAGPAGLAAARIAGASGARVMLLDDQPEAGGSLLSRPALIDGEPAAAWIAASLAALRAIPEVKILPRTTAFGYQDHNLVTACERLTEHLPVAERKGPRERLWKIRAQQVILATGAHERPIVFGNNDLPGIMLASAISTYVQRYGVLPGRRALVFSNNDDGYQAALDLHSAGAQVTVIDPRAGSEGTLPAAVAAQGIRILYNAMVVQAMGSRHVQSAQVFCDGVLVRADCDLIGMSGGWNPVISLFAQSGGKAEWHATKACFIPGAAMPGRTSVGAASGEFGLAAALRDGAQAGRDCAKLTGFRATQLPLWQSMPVEESPLLPLWLVGDRKRAQRGAKQFVDYQNDVSAADIFLAAREGYQSIEHVKRYTAMGFGTDQGKLGNINGMAILADALGQSIPETGTTTFRPNYTPVTFGTLAGRELGDYFEPIRKTCIHTWHVAQGAVFEDVGAWKRPQYYPRAGEDLYAAVARECLAVRNGVGILDASTLGKIDIKGPDAITLLNWMYSNAWNKLETGKCRYGLMLDENGMVFDDGVTARLGEQHYLMSTTSGGAARVLAWMERWLQTEWPELKVHLTSVTEQFATFAVAGPHSRKVLQQVCEGIDLSNAAFPFMGVREGSIAGVFARVMRISFSGELSYEVNVPAECGAMVWDKLLTAGQAYGITPYGTEAMHVLRAEKGYIIVGQDTDGSVTPADLGMAGLIAKSKDFLGKRSLTRVHTAGAERKQLVGLLTSDAALVLPEGHQILRQPSSATTAPTVGHVTSSYMSPVLGRSIALALVKGGLTRMGETVAVALPGGKFASAVIASPVFFDAEGARQNVE
jgi:sarcosine oxidase subunit alpha